MKSPRSPHDAIVVPSSGPIYDGRAGQTRKERVHLVEPDGTVRSLEVYRVVNVVTHPQLKPRVLAGQLHRLDDGRELALPFVYHDPITRKFALVIPPVLAHLEMKEWARLMTEVAEDTSHSVPGYVRDGTTVLGLGALEMFLESGVEPDDAELSVMSEPPSAQRQKLRAREQELAERKRLLDERNKEVSEQEQALVRMAEDLSARERSFEHREQQIATARADVEAREQELMERSKRPRGDTRAADVVPDGEWQEVRTEDSLTLSREQKTVVTELAQVARSQAPLEVDDSELSDLAAGLRGGAPPPLRKRSRNPPPLATAQNLASPVPTVGPVRHSPPPLRPQQPEPPPAAIGVRSNPPPLPAGSDPPSPARAPTDVAAAAQPKTPSSKPEPKPGAPNRPSSPPVATPVTASVRPSGAPLASTSARPSGAPPAPEPPPGFAALPVPGMALRQEHGDLWLFVKLDRSAAQTLAQEPELLVQLAQVGGRPMVVLALILGASSVVRVAFDGQAVDTRALLERLAQTFRAHLALYVDGQLEATRAVAAPRESNARAILERLAQPRAASKLGAAKALEQVLRQPPPVYDEQLPFGAPRPQAASTSSVLEAIRKLELWARPDKLEQALLVYSVPKHVIEASCRRALRAAIGFGIALPESLVKLALEHKLAENKPQLVIEQLAAFRQRIEHGHNDLAPASTLRNWEKLFAQADEADLAVEPELRKWVERSAKESGAPPPDLPLSSAEVRRDLGDPGRRLEAVRELCRRGHPSAVGPIFGVLDELSPEEVASAVVALLTFGEHAADGLVAALDSPSQYVRHACALGLGHLKLRRTLPALLKHIESEATPSWTEMARALGDFGAPALKTVTRGLKEGERRERFMVGLAHLANHGCAEEVKTLESDPDPTLALAARQALARRSRMEWEDQAVRNQQPLRDNSPESRFSQVFYAEAARTTEN